MSISTHVLDAVRGRPASGLRLRLEQRVGSAWVPISRAVTDADGRVAALAPQAGAGVFRLTFDTEDYLDVETFYPEVAITFRVVDPEAHHHVPLLLSPFAYSTYRGS